MEEYVKIQFRGRRRSRFKIGYYFRILSPMDIIEIPVEAAAELCRQHNFKAYDEVTDRAIKLFCNLPWDYLHINKKLLGKRCFIVGRGGSLKGFDFGRLEGEFVIAVNEAFMSCRSDAMVFCDSGLWKNNRDELSKYEGTIFAAERTRYYEEDKRRNVVIFPINNGNAGVGIEDGLYCGASSGMIALNLAQCMGADKIYLLGFDLNEEEKDIYFDDDEDENSGMYKDKKRNTDQVKMYREAFGHYRNVYNCSPVSRIDAFPQISIDEVL